MTTPYHWCGNSACPKCGVVEEVKPGKADQDYNTEQERLVAEAADDWADGADWGCDGGWPPPPPAVNKQSTAKGPPVEDEW